MKNTPFFLLIFVIIFTLKNYSTSFAGSIEKPILIPIISPQIEANIDMNWKWYSKDVTTFRIKAALDTVFKDAKLFTDVKKKDMKIDPNGLVTFTRPFPLSQDLFPVANVFWKVQARKINPEKPNDTLIAWSDISSFKLIHQRLPVNIRYENPAHNRELTLRWSYLSSHLGSDVLFLNVNYDSLNLINDVGNLYSIKFEKAKDSLFQFNDTTPLPQQDTTLYWKLVYFDYEDTLKRFSTQIYPIKLVPDSIPIPIPNKTKNNSVRPTFYWKKAGFTTEFTFELDNNINFYSPIISTPVYNNFYIPSQELDDNVTYYWRVRSNNYRSWSQIHEFKYDPSPILNKFNGDICDTAKPTFRWEKNKKGSDDFFEFRIADNREFHLPFIVDTITEGKTYYKIQKELEINKWYFWKIGFIEKDTIKYTAYDSLRTDIKFIPPNNIKNINKFKLDHFQFISSKIPFVG